MIPNEGTKFYRHHSHYAPYYMLRFIIFMNLNYDVTYDAVFLAFIFHLFYFPVCFILIIILVWKQEQ